MYDIRFYDNELRNWDSDMKIFENNHVRFIHVDETPNQIISPIQESIENKNREYIRMYNDYWLKRKNTYAEYLDGIPIKSQSFPTYPKNGLDIEEAIEWAMNRGKTKIFLTDWDATITVCEGMAFGKNHELLTLLELKHHPYKDIVYESTESIKKTIKFEDAVEYVMGGKERLERLREMFRMFNANNVHVYVLTNNPNASKMSPCRVIYLELLMELMPEKTVNELDAILYSSQDTVGYKKHESSCRIDMLKKVLRDKCREGDKPPLLAPSAPRTKKHKKRKYQNKV